MGRPWDGDTGPWDDHGMGIGPWDDYGRYPLAFTDRDPLLAGLGHSIQTVQQYKQRAEVSDRQDLREQVSRVRFARDPLDRKEFAVTKVAEETPDDDTTRQPAPADTVNFPPPKPQAANTTADEEKSSR